MSLAGNRPYSGVFISCTKFFYSFCNFPYDFDNNFRFSKNHFQKETTTGDLLTTLKSTLTCVNFLDQKPLLCTGSSNEDWTGAHFWASLYLKKNPKYPIYLIFLAEFKNETKNLFKPETKELRYGLGVF